MNKSVFKTAGLLSLAVLVLSVLSVAGGWIFINSSYFSAGAGDTQSVEALFARPMACIGVLSIAFAIASFCAYYSENDGYAVFSGVLAIFCMLNSAFDFFVNYTSFDLNAVLKLASSLACLLLLIFFFVASKAYGKANGELAVVSLAILSAVAVINTLTNIKSAAVVSVVVSIAGVAVLATLTFTAVKAFRNKKPTVIASGVGIVITVAEFLVNRFVVKSISEVSFVTISNAFFAIAFYVAILIYTCKALQENE